MVPQSRLLCKRDQVLILLLPSSLAQCLEFPSILLNQDKGNLIQQGTPLELIKQDGGKFQALCQAAGEEEYHLEHGMMVWNQSLPWPFTLYYSICLRAARALCTHSEAMCNDENR
jgi:hypothetical protein